MTKEQNRKDFPEFSKFIDEFRQYFPNANPIWGQEGGKELGKEQDWDNAVKELLPQSGIDKDFYNK